MGIPNIFVDPNTVVEKTAEIVTAYVGRNDMTPENLLGLIHDVKRLLLEDVSGEVHSSESAAASPAHDAKAAPAAGPRRKPSVPIEESVGHDHLICLEDGRKFRSLKRHLNDAHGMTVEQYKAKWGLDRDYPIVAPSYTEERSKFAHRVGLGHRQRTKAG
jgi:predicted transcriptional regulator